MREFAVGKTNPMYGSFEAVRMLDNEEEALQLVEKLNPYRLHVFEVYVVHLALNDAYVVKVDVTKEPYLSWNADEIVSRAIEGAVNIGAECVSRECPDDDQSHLYWCCAQTDVWVMDSEYPKVFTKGGRSVPTS